MSYLGGKKVCLDPLPISELDCLRVFRFLILHLSRMGSLCILDIRSLPDIWFANFFSHSLNCIYMFLMVTFAMHSFLDWGHPTCLFLLLLLLFLISKKSLPRLMIGAYHLYFPLEFLWFQVLHSSLNSFWANVCVWYKKVVQLLFCLCFFFFFFLHMDVQFSQHHLLKELSFYHYIFLTRSSQINWPYVQEFIPGGSSILFHYLCVLGQYHTILTRAL